MKIGIAVCAAALLAGCATTEGVTSLKTGADAGQRHDMEERLWHEASEADTAIERSGLVADDVRATAYVQGVMDRLFPEFKGTITLRIHESTHLNAFAMANGSVYVNIGMLARMENEAQLAAVLAHEAIHFIEKHSFRQRVTAKNMAAFAVSGVPFSSLAAVSSISGFSRDHEREADSKGYERMVAAGYDPREAHKVFQILADEVKALKEEQPYFFASHPLLSERVETYRQLAAQHPGGGRIDAEPYNRVVAPLRLETLARDVSQDRFASVILVMEDAKKRALYPPAASYWLGEAYARRDARGDDAKALAAWRAAEKAAPQFAPTYMRLGLHAIKSGAKPAARRYFERYLALAPKDAPERGYVQQYLASL
jgi:beta-barrel assembly-enhancing protease